MGSLQWFLLFFIIFFFLFKRLLLYALNLIFTHKLKIEVRLGQVALLPPSVQNTYFLFKNFTVHIDKVRLTSSFVNADTKRLLGLLIEDVRFTRDCSANRNTSHEASILNPSETNRVNLLEKILPVLTSFVQFMCVSISNVTIVAQLNNNQLVHASINNLSLDGSILPRSQIALCGLVDAFSFRLLQTVATNERDGKITHSSHSIDTRSRQPCLSEFSVGVQTEIHVDPVLPAVTKLMLNISNPKLSVNDRLLKALEAKSVQESGPTQKNNLANWSLYFPRKCEFNVSGIEIKLYRHEDETFFVRTSLNLLEVTADTTLDTRSGDSLFDTNVKLHIQMLYSETKFGRWFSLSELDATVQVFSGNIDSTVNANRIAIVYSNTELLPWFKLILSKKKKARSEDKTASSRQTPLTLNFEVWDLSAVALFQDALPLRSGITHVQLQLVDHPATGGLSCEFEGETVWCCLGNRTPSDPGQKKVHFWNSPIYVGLVIGKIERRLGVLGMSDSMHSQLLLDVLRFEWSPNLIETILAIRKDLPRWGEVEDVSVPEEKTPVRVSHSLTVASANIFLMMKKECALMLRVDSLAADQQPDKTVASIEGLKGLFIVPGAPFSCAKSFEIKKGNLELLRLQLSLRKSAKSGTIDVDQLGLNWDTRLHMAVLQVIEEWKGFRGHFTQPKPVKISSPNQSESETKQSWTVSLKHKTTICAILSPAHTIQFQADDSRAVVNGHPRTTFELNLPRCALLFDGHSIIEAEGLNWKLADNDLDLKQERLSFDCQAITNKCGLVSVAGLRVCFPYRYQFSEACQQEMVSVFKWLKLLHKKPRPAGYTEPLYRDIRLSVAKFSMVLCDDPFEVKLRDNYELREDEFRESLKRKRMLDAKIEELRRTHPLLTQGKIDELYANLGGRNVEIFVQRAQRMYETRPMRTALFRWEMEEVDLVALADPSFHGYANVVRNIQEMDPDSPWPDEELEFTTLWCRAVRATSRQLRFLLRDFPQPLLDIHELLLFGRLAGAEQQSSWRARRTCNVFIAPPWSDVQIERGMNQLKFYHDFSCDAESWRLAYGACWEPVIAQCNLAWDFVSPPSKDPSPALPFWDKMRLLFHGRITLSVQQLTLLLHTSLDPYNTTEEMELTWTDLAMDWTNANFILKGEFNVYVRTASKYDDCRLLHLPRLKLTIGLTWHCLADPNEHLAVQPCAPNRIPEYSSNQEHDSYRAFRSQSVTLAVSLETKASVISSNSSAAEVHALVYGSTLRWFENLKCILSGVSRPTRRGPLFQNTKPRKSQLSRHYKAVRLALSLHRFHIYYWMSASMQRGFELICGRLTMSSEHALRLVAVEDGLKHRPRADWSIVFLNCELNEAEVWLQSALGSDSDDNAELNVSLRQPVEKFYFLSVQRVSYGREAVLTPPFVAPGTASIVPTHRLVVQDLRAAWTKSNRQVAFALYDSWVKAQVLKRNLSAEVMKLLRMPESSVSPMKPRTSARISTEGAQPTPCKSNAGTTSSSSTGSTTAATSTPVVDSMLQQLLADHRNVVFSEDLSSTGSRPAVTGTSTSEGQEGVHLNWLIELVNSQVLLKGCETKGYIILAAAHAKILQRLHPPVWRDRSLVSKTSWVCSFDGMQYFATISAGEQDALDENILWLSTDHIGSAARAESQTPSSLDYLPDMVGSGQSVGGVISETVGGCDSSALQLQRIVSRCNCEIVFVSYGQNTLDLDLDNDLEGLMDIPPPPSDDVMDLWAQREQPVDSFTLTHHDLNICTNSLQYEMLLDVINNLLLHVEPHRKEASERLQRLRFQLQLSSTEDQRRPVQQIQNQLRSLISQLRRLEKDTFMLQRALAEDPSNAQLIAEFDSLERKVYECKEQLNAANEELAMMVSCLKEVQLTAHQRLQAARQGSNVTTVRTSQINFKHAQWRLTEADGQLGIADVVLTNFLYNKLSKSDDACEHSLEIGYVSLANLLPNQIYKQVIVPTELNRNMPVDRQVAVRMFSRDKAPVGGICIKEIFEVNVVPFTFAMTYQFFKTMMRFCFPEKDPETLDGEGEHSESSTVNRKGGKHFSNVNKAKRGKESSFYVPIEDDVEKMKERAEKNKLFIYIKIPEVPVKVSYKGGKEKNIEDVHEFSLVVPTLEYHNVTWTWLDLFLAMKNDSKRVLLSQAIKQKLQIRPRSHVEEGGTPQEEDKARLLLGGLSMPGDARSSKRGGFWKPSK
ncbi:hypothetical protein OUZ56_015296 [Daphnia magna]|uniref:FMP27/BLTP2/Hobbit GFWDK motif-containing RBG unit domain-containing protein n=1 Tax=Daphnia magna TaxID=35525 RepID=A0ABR0AME7_9CRUS|nr:hypothetical protein OUZ56_015296 [Daphnia magna]